MKALKVIGIIILILIVLFFIVALFLPKNTEVKASVRVNAPANTVFKQVNTMENWDHWSPFQDPAMEIVYMGEKTGVGAMQTWNMEGDSGSLTIIESVPYQSIKTNVDLMEDDEVNGNWTFVEENGYTEVSWGIRFQNLSYPMERYLGIVFKMMMESSLQNGLEQLKKYAEGLPPYPEVILTKIEEMKTITMTDTVYFSEMAEKMDLFFGKMEKFAKAKRLKMSGYPFCIYLSWDPEKGYTYTRCGFPVDREVQGNEEIDYYVIEPKKAVMSVYKGPYDKMESTYTALEEYIAEFGLQMNGAPMEMYVTDPMQEPDTSKWTTNIYFPVK
ncbi:MAG: GyrI-like domain-containing protein [Bacteroidales bacterium]|nr:GyrI-like domain-containing protein [Bacteroidales bacterium]MCF8387470.1 GyrI-like domain-containing protein [Bacteroidales bacterium]MCF8398910.1 GyrI-like domain-containing protein [Bacteroidales bacterium]